MYTSICWEKGLLQAQRLQQPLLFN